MLFSEINPMVRYARYVNITEELYYHEVVPLDARLFYCLRGYGKIRVKNTEYEMLPYSLLIINSGIPYEILTPENLVCYIALNFDYTQKAAAYSIPIQPVLRSDFQKEMLVDFNTFQNTGVLSDVLYIKQFSSIQGRMNAIVSEYMKKLMYYETKIGHLLADCIADSIRFLETSNANSEKESSDRILSYIHENYRENLTNSIIGNIFGYHPTYISSLIKQMTGMPIHQYIIHIRLMNAVTLLENTSFSVAEVAAACGFYDAAYFSRYFKKHFGILPSKYRSI